MTTTSPSHRWEFFRAGGSDQVALERGADILAIDQFDPKLWVALACPVKGLTGGRFGSPATIEMMLPADTPVQAPAGACAGAGQRIVQRCRVAALAAMTVLASSACASRALTPDPTAVRTPAPSAEPATRRTHTDADVRFMQQMLLHHAQAVTLAAMVPSRTTRDDLRSLAERIDVSQADEMRYMADWLRDRGAEVPDPAHAHHAGHADMPGMLTAPELEQLRGLTGPAFDRLFLTFMVKHHEGALVMVEALFSSPGAGQEPEIFGFASDVDGDQRAEIARMRALLDRLGPASTP